MSNVIISEGVEEIGILAFNKCGNIGNIEIPASVKKISSYAFNCCWISNPVTIKFYRTSDIDYNEIMLFNNHWVTICVPEEAKEMYEVELITFKLTN